MIGIPATFIAMVVVVITAYDQPFVGDLQVQAESFRLVLETAVGGCTGGSRAFSAPL
jgi:hypothetical protein